MTVFVAKVEVKPPPLVVVRTLICRHLSLIQSPLEGGPYICGNLLHGNVCGCYLDPAHLRNDFIKNGLKRGFRSKLSAAVDRFS
jgi:hypothetical protein